MPERLPDDMRRDVEATIRSKASESRIVDVHATVEEIRLRHAVPEIRIADMAVIVARLAAQYGCAVELGGQCAEPDSKPAA
ncbi:MULTISPECIES: hypothetical protein [Bosea]|jgi:hypothetical protein|nr:hypothetical protein [Bosea vaviloviae]